MTTSKQDVEGMFRRLCRSATSTGVDTSEWSFVEGSATYGRAWRLYRITPFTHAQHPPVPGMDDYLGTTRREAYLSLYGMVRAFEAVASLAGAR